MSASLYITKERLVCIQITATQHKNWILLLRWYLFDCRKDWEGVIGVRPPTALRNTNPNVVEYKGLVGVVTSGATTTIHGVGRKLR